MVHYKQWDTVLGKLDSMQQQLGQVLKQQEQLMTQAAFAVRPVDKDNGTTVAAIVSPVPSHIKRRAHCAMTTIAEDKDIDWEESDEEKQEKNRAKDTADEFQFEGNGHPVASFQTPIKLVK